MAGWVNGGVAESLRFLNHNFCPAACCCLASPPFKLENLPHDIITGETLKYRLTANGQFLLYSLGWNQRDDDGNAEKDKGVWVWPVEVSK